ncbi:MAG: alkaline phosphatase, partial [bacterium]|nr:alkaline phosphatase [bacterium]
AGAATEERYRYAIVTGMNYSFFHHTGNKGRTKPYAGADKHLGYPGLASIHKLQPDFFVGTGDNVYYDHPGPRGRAQTQHEMRKKHHEQYSQPRFLDLFRQAATYWLKDDHDHRFNDSDPVNPVLIRTPTRAEHYPKTNVHAGESGSGFLPSHELGVRVFREQLPVVDPRDPVAVTHRTYRVSKHLQVWFVEGRDYRSPNDMPDGPGKTIWGGTQKRWLKQTLVASDATFKLLISATPMVGPDGGNKRDSHVNINGFRHEGDEFFEWLKKNGFSPKNFFIACGDRHWQYHAVHPSGFEEFSCGALVDANAILGTFPGDKNSTDPEGKVKHKFHSPEASGGFLIVTVGPGPVAEFVFYDEFGKELYRHQKRD